MGDALGDYITSRVELRPDLDPAYAGVYFINGTVHIAVQHGTTIAHDTFERIEGADNVGEEITKWLTS